MLSRLVQRVLPRTFAPGVVVTSALRPSLLARQQFAARTFWATAYVAEPAAKAKAKTTKTTKRKPAAKKKVAGKKTKAKAKAKPKAKAKAKAAKPKKDAKDDPDARFKKGLLAVKIPLSERPPLKSSTPYSLYLQEVFKSEGPLGSKEAFGPKAKEISARWRALSDEEKKRYSDLAVAARDKFRQQREQWFANADPRILRALNAQRKAKNLPRIRPPASAHKRPLTGFMRFVEQTRDSVEVSPNLPPQQAVRERAKKQGEMWNALPEAEKERYNQEYKEALAEWKQANKA